MQRRREKSQHEGTPKFLSEISMPRVILNMSNTPTRRHIVVSPHNIELLKNFGRAQDSMNDAVTEVLRRVTECNCHKEEF